jgi:hypothetical protein
MGKDNGTARTAFADFAHQNYEFEIISPDGESMIVEMRDITADELLDTTRDLKSPEAPMKQNEPFAKDRDGNLVMQLDYENPAYLKALMQFRQHQMAAQIEAVWLTDIPGETREEKIENIIGLPSWAFGGLWRACELVTATSEERIKRRSFRRHRKAEASSVG